MCEDVFENMVGIWFCRAKRRGGCLNFYFCRTEELGGCLACDLGRATVLCGVRAVMPVELLALHKRWQHATFGRIGTGDMPPLRAAQGQPRLSSYKLGLTASQVVRLIGLLLVFASQKIVHDVQNEMAEVVVT